VHSHFVGPIGSDAMATNLIRGVYLCMCVCVCVCVCMCLCSQKTIGGQVKMDLITLPDSSKGNVTKALMCNPTLLSLPKRFVSSVDSLDKRRANVESFFSKSGMRVWVLCLPFHLSSLHLFLFVSSCLAFSLVIRCWDRRFRSCLSDHATYLFGFACVCVCVCVCV
jgi:hypothetical protein